MSDGRRKTSTSTTFHLLAGLASGFTSAFLLQPVDLLKTRVQQSRSSSLLSSLKHILSQPRPIRQLWRGTLPSCLRTSVGSALYFTSLNSMRQSLAKQQTRTARSTSSSTLPQLTPGANLASGAVARASIGFIMMPITVIKVRYESSYYNYTSIVSAARDIVGREGLRGFFAGFGATALRDAPFAGLYVVFYEQCKKVLSGLVISRPITPLEASLHKSKPQLRELRDRDVSMQSPQMTAITSASINFASSTLAAALSTAVTNPPDAIKTRLQLYPAKYRNMVQTLKLMLSEEGVRSLFDGLVLRMSRKALSSALAWTVYEDLMRRSELRWASDGS